MLWVVRACVGAVGPLLMAVMVAAAAARAQTPPPGVTDGAGATATARLTATAIATPAALSLRFDGERIITWDAVPGAIVYEVRGAASVVRTDAARPICEPPLVPDQRSINLSATLGEGTTSFAIPLPELPAEDRWFVATLHVQVTALDAAGAGVAGGRMGHVAEAACALPPVPTPLAEATRVGGCEIPAGYLEVTTPAAREHGQRVFDSADFGTRVYVRADGSCVWLRGGLPPVPEFAPDLVPSATPIADGALARALPGTGGGGVAPADGSRAAVGAGAWIAGMAIVALLGGICVRSRRRI